MKFDLSLKQEFLRAVYGSTGVYFFGTALSFLIGIQLARGLGVAGYGLYGSAVAVASFGATVAAGGLQLHATREIAAYKSRGDGAGAVRVFKWSVRILLTLSIIVALCVGGYVSLAQGASSELASAAMALTVLTASLSLTSAVLRGTGALVLGQALDAAIRPTIQAGLLIFCLVNAVNLTPTIAIAIAAASIVLSFPASFGAIKKLLAGSYRDELRDKDESRLWSRAARTMALTTIVRGAETALPLIIIGALSSMEEAGLYRVASSSMVFIGVAETMVTIMIPAITTRLYVERNFPDLKLLTAAACITMTVPTLAIAIVIWIFGESLLGFVFGIEFSLSWPALALLSVGGVISSMGGISIALLHSSGMEKIVTRAFAFSLVVSAIGSLLLVQLGALGVAASMVIGVFLRTIWLVSASIRILNIDPTIFGTLKTFFPKLFGQ